MANQFAVLGIMQLLVNNSITTQQAEEIVNMWIELTARKFYKEGELDGLKRAKKKWQEIKDMGME